MIQQLNFISSNNVHNSVEFLRKLQTKSPSCRLRYNFDLFFLYVHENLSPSSSCLYSNPSSVPSHSVDMIASGSEKECQSPIRGDLNSGVKQVLVIDDDHNGAIAIKACLESYLKEDLTRSKSSAIQVTMYSNPVKALLELKPYYYDLLLVDINMPSINGYELVEKVIKLDVNIKICFMSSGEVNYEAIREIRHPCKSFRLLH